MSELAPILRELIAAAAEGDRSLARFGARQHRYELRPPLSRDELAAIEVRTGPLPADLAVLATTFASGGAGPYHGWLPLDEATPYVLRDFRALPVGHLGCGYAAVVALDGDVRGTVWIDARAIGVVAPMHPSFVAYYEAWTSCLARNQLPAAFVPPGACALAAALGGYLGVHEQRLGLEPGTIAGDALRDALAQLGPGAIEIAASQSPLYAEGTAVAPCIACARLLDNLGLAADVVRDVRPTR